MKERNDHTDNERIKARVIAMYLPQFHRTEVNDRYWGEGFTEWDNVTKARPLFKGHEQPKLPDNTLGFYDLSRPEIRELQARLAADAGIEGFMYWHYWFGNGTMALNRPLEDVLSSGTPDYPFCMGWANHSWHTGSWTAAGGRRHKSVTIFNQLYPGVDDHIAHFNYCLPAFRDKRYITVDQCPLFAIWAPCDIPDLKGFIKLWKSLATEAGLKGLHLTAIRVSRKDMTVDELIDAGFDSVNNCNYNMWRAECHVAGSKWLKMARSFLSQHLNAALQRYDYAEIIKWMCDDTDRREDVYPTILPGYDRSPRAGRKAQIYTGNTPQLFASHAADAISRVADKSPEHRIILLKSWNEWGEGNYMEPDRLHGAAFLAALKEALYHHSADISL